MNLRALMLFLAILECVAGLVLYRMGQEYVTVLIGAAISYLLAELLQPNRR